MLLKKDLNAVSSFRWVLVPHFRETYTETTFLVRQCFNPLGMLAYMLIIVLSTPLYDWLIVQAQNEVGQELKEVLPQ